MGFTQHITLFILIAVFSLPASGEAEEKITIYAAASTTNAITDLAKTWEKMKGVKVRTSFASSSSLARQIEAGAPAQIYLSANPKWMNYLEKKDLIDSKSRRDLLSNSLVIIAPQGRAFPLKMTKGFDFAAAFEGKLAMGDPNHVPAGIYAKEALVSFGWWKSISRRVAGAMDVRFAMSFVERGEAAAGIVYATDAKLSHKVTVIGTFPPHSHTPIAYPVTLLKGAGAAAEEFLKFLLSEKARYIFTRYGFTVKNARGITP